jgi:hypothetical protein
MLGWDRGVRFGSPHEGLVDGYGVCLFFYETVADPIATSDGQAENSEARRNFYLPVLSPMSLLFVCSTLRALGFENC